jgi:hypothetical protein
MRIQRLALRRIVELELVVTRYIPRAALGIGEDAVGEGEGEGGVCAAGAEGCGGF